MILRLLKWLWRRKNYCPSCMGRGVVISSRCKNGHIICASCSEVGVSQCLHHFCDDTQQYFEPKNAINPEVALLRDENRQLKLRIERDAPAPIVLPQPTPRPQPTRYRPVIQQPQIWTTTDTADTADFGYTLAGDTGTTATTDVSWRYGIQG